MKSTKFKIGDRVKCISNNIALEKHKDKEGIVEIIHDYKSFAYPIRVRYDKGHTICFTENELKLVKENQLIYDIY